MNLIKFDLPDFIWCLNGTVVYEEFETNNVLNLQRFKVKTPSRYK